MNDNSFEMLHKGVLWSVGDPREMVFSRYVVLDSSKGSLERWFTGGQLLHRAADSLYVVYVIVHNCAGTPRSEYLRVV